MFLPHQRERVKNALLRAGLSEKQIEDDDLVDNFLTLATHIHKIWVRHTPEARNSAPPQEGGAETARAPPRK